MSKQAGGILFTTDMLKGIISDRKTQTRRIVKPQPIALPIPENETVDANVSWRDLFWHEKNTVPDQVNKCAPFVPGTWLYVKETFYQFGYWQKNGKTAAGRQRWKFVADIHTNKEKFFYDTISNATDTIRSNSFRRYGLYKRVARFMPRVIARYFILIKAGHMERIKQITRTGAAKEGVCFPDDEKPSWVQSHRWPEENFETLWCMIHGNHSWMNNDWVWVYDFEFNDLGF